MSQNNLPDNYNWEDQIQDDQAQTSCPIQDEVISVYEVYVKEETIGPDGKTQVSVVSSIPGSNQHPLIEGDLELDAVIESDIINVDGSVSDLQYKIFEPNETSEEGELVVYSPSNAEASSTGTTRLVDKDDPRSRLHFVKYLKRDGKTVKIWECGICSKEFRHQYTLMRHLPTHTDERNFKCEACGKAFRQLSTLSQHKAIHSDARPYVCEFCKKTFNRVSTLISHRKTHSQHKPHKCHICGKGFHQKGNLRNHVFTHTNERPYKCDICGKGFNQMSNLVCHKVKAHAEVEKMKYVCGLCDKEFPRRFSLRAHEELKHGIKYRNTSTGALSKANIKHKGVRIIELPDDERNVITDVKEKDILHTSTFSGSIFVDKIETKAMESALLQGQTPFALYKPLKGIPVLVRVSSTENSKHELTPATAEDLRMTGNIDMCSKDNAKSVQVKVPVVATITEKVESNGSRSYLIEPPGSDQEEENIITPLESNFYPEKPSGSTPISSPEDCNELLELAAQGGIQFVRATEDGHYEVMSNSEARELMAQNSHDVTILDGEEAEAISLSSNRQNVQEIINDDENEFMIVDPMKVQKNIPINSIELLEDKELRILECKDLDERYGEGISFLSQSKIDDIILGPKFNEAIEVAERDDDDIELGANRLDFTNFLSHRSEIPTIKSSYPTSGSILNKAQHPLAIRNENLAYLRNQSFSDDLSLLAISGPNDCNSAQEYSTLSITDLDDGESSVSVNCIQPDVRILSTRHQNGMCIQTQNNQKLSNANGEVKILGQKPKNMVINYQDIKFLNSYDYYLKNSHFGPVAEYQGEVKELNALENKLESSTFIDLDDPMNNSWSNNSSSSSGYESPELKISPEKENRDPDSRTDHDNYAHAATSSGADFLNFDSCDLDSPGSRFERSLKDKDPPTKELPNLN